MVSSSHECVYTFMVKSDCDDSLIFKTYHLNHKCTMITEQCHELIVPNTANASKYILTGLNIDVQ